MSARKSKPSSWPGALAFNGIHVTTEHDDPAKQKTILYIGDIWPDGWAVKASYCALFAVAPHLRELLERAIAPELDNGYERCLHCRRQTHAGEQIIHGPGCVAGEAYVLVQQLKRTQEGA